MIKLCQRDQKWADTPIGKTPYLLKRFGCTITCISMFSDYFAKFKGFWKSPKDLASKLQFTKDGLIIWASLPEVLPFRLEKRLYSRNDSEIKISLKDSKRAVALQVDNFHWLAVVGKGLLGGWVVYDPWDGLKKTIPNKSYKAITGSAHFILS